ncbi:MAG: sulfotransferase [Pseudomonadota bacterium]
MISQLDKNYIYARPSKVISRIIAHAMFEGRPLTTKARWINRFVFAQYALVKHIPQLKKVEKPIYILGTGRSGSTILGKVLSLHPSVTFLNEPKALWHSAYPNEDVLGNFEERKAARFRLTSDDASIEVSQRVHRFYGYALALTGGRRILDKHGELIFRIEFLKKIFPNAKFLLLRRNGWDTIQSMATWSRRNTCKIGTDIHDWWGVNRRKFLLLVEDIAKDIPSLNSNIEAISSLESQEDMAAVEWITTMRTISQLTSSSMYNVYQVKFEEFTQSPVEVLKNILDYCELEHNKALLTYANKVVKPLPSKGKVELNKFVMPAFEEMMIKMNYKV